MLKAKISYFFFKRRLKAKLSALYESSDPWRSQDLRDPFLPLIREVLEQRTFEAKSLPVLDAGGGEGWFYDPVSDLISRYHLLDIHPIALERARQRISKSSVQFIEKSLDEFKPQRNTYGAIWLFSVLSYLGGEKHSHYVQKILSRLWNSLCPGGVFLVIYPYYSSAEKEKLLYATNGFASGRSEALLLQKDFPGAQQSFLFLAYRKLEFLPA